MNHISVIFWIIWTILAIACFVFGWLYGKKRQEAIDRLKDGMKEFIRENK